MLRRAVMILDATAFYAGLPYTGLDTYYTTDSVVKEVSHIKARSASLGNLVEAGRLKIHTPSKRYIEQVKEAARKSGDFSLLSVADVSVLALGLEFKGRDLQATIVSDDYSVENLAHLLSLNVSSVMTKGIKKVVRWLLYCSGCGKVFQDRGVKVCDVCGSPLKRKFRTANDLSQAV